MNLRAEISQKINDLLDDETSIFWLVGLLFFGFLVFLLFSFSSEPKTLANWSSIGASFGALSALFTGLAFAGLIVTIVQQKRQLGMQSDELKLQRKELKATRKVLKKQNKEFKIQSDTMKRQQFEGTFFKLYDQFIKRSKIPLFELEAPHDVDEFHYLIKGLNRYKLQLSDIYQTGNSNIERINELILIYLLEKYINIDFTKNLIGVLIQILTYCSENGLKNDSVYIDILKLDISESEKFLTSYFAIIGTISRNDLILLHQYGYFNEFCSDHYPDNHKLFFENFIENKTIPIYLN